LLHHIPDPLHTDFCEDLTYLIIIRFFMQLSQRIFAFTIREETFHVLWLLTLTGVCCEEKLEPPPLGYFTGVHI